MTMLSPARFGATVVMSPKLLTLPPARLQQLHDLVQDALPEIEQLPDNVCIQLTLKEHSLQNDWRAIAIGLCATLVIQSRATGKGQASSINMEVQSIPETHTSHSLPQEGDLLVQKVVTGKKVVESMESDVDFLDRMLAGLKVLLPQLVLKSSQPAEQPAQALLPGVTRLTHPGKSRLA